MENDTCDRCIHCTHKAYEYFYCELINEYISRAYALNPEIGCDTFVEELDDNETEKH